MTVNSYIKAKHSLHNYPHSILITKSISRNIYSAKNQTMILETERSTPLIYARYGGKRLKTVRTLHMHTPPSPTPAFTVLSNLTNWQVLPSPGGFCFIKMHGHWWSSHKGFRFPWWVRLGRPGEKVATADLFQELYPHQFAVRVQLLHLVIQK